MPEHPCEAVNRSKGKYVRGEAHANGMESFRSLLKRGYYGTHRRMSSQHLKSYMAEFAGRHNCRNADTADRMLGMPRGLTGRLLTWKALTGVPAAA